MPVSNPGGGSSGGSSVPTRVAFFGDSFSEGVPGPTRQTLAFPERVAAMLGCHADNYGVGGARNHQTTNTILSRALQVTKPPIVAPYQPAHQVAVIQASINNLNLPTVITDLSIVTRSLARAIRHIRAAGTYEALDTGRFTYGGSWSTILGDTNSGTGVKRATANASTWSLAVPSDFPGGILRVYGFKAPTFGAIHTITVDGAAHGTIDNRDATATNGSEPWEYPITLTAGTHTVAGTISSIATVENMNGADFEGTDSPIVVVLNTAKTRNYPGGTHTIVDADVTASNAAVAAMLAAQFPGDARVVLIDVDALLGKNDAYLNADGIHPNDAGHALIAAAISSAVVTARVSASSLLAAAQVTPFDAPLARRSRELTTDPRSGVATLVAGTKVVTSRVVTASSRIVCGIQSLGTVAVPKAIGVTARTAGTSFTLTSADATDTSVVWWEIVEPETV
jgi:lysophospholipase L1-like esterase